MARKAKVAKKKSSSSPFVRVAAQLREHALNPQVDTNSATAILRIIADVLEKEGR